MRDETVFLLPVPAKGTLKIAEKRGVATAIFQGGNGPIALCAGIGTLRLRGRRIHF
jgi:hypothetical protein